MGTIQLISIKEFCASHGVEHTYLFELQEYGFVELKQEEFIEETEVPKVEKVMRLHHEMGINFEGIDVILNLLDRVDNMNSEMTRLRNRLLIYEDL